MSAMSLLASLNTAPLLPGAAAFTGDCATAASGCCRGDGAAAGLVAGDAAVSVFTAPACSMSRRNQPTVMMDNKIGAADRVLNQIGYQAVQG